MPSPQTDGLTPGAPAPDFALPVINGQGVIRLGDLRGHIVVLDFWSYECPWSQRYDPYFKARLPEWDAQGIRFLAIDSNANEPDEQARAALLERDLPFTVLRDEGNAVADAYGAITTPHVFVVDRDGRLAYRGAVDDLTWRQKEATVTYLGGALAALLAGHQPDPAETQARGCTIVRAIEA